MTTTTTAATPTTPTTPHPTTTTTITTTTKHRHHYYHQQHHDNTTHNQRGQPSWVHLPPPPLNRPHHLFSSPWALSSSMFLHTVTHSPHSLARAWCACLPALAHPTRCGGPSARLIVEGLGPTNCGSGVALAHNAALPPRILHRPTCHTVLLYTEDVDTGKLSTDVHTRAPPFPGPPSFHGHPLRPEHLPKRHHCRLE